MKLILVRHGQTEENKLKIFQGSRPGKLSQKGIEQVKSVALRLKNEKIDCIYSSNQKRAIDTVKEIHKFHKDVPLYFDDQLREIDMGDWTGKQINKVDRSNPPSNIEPYQDTYDRIHNFVSSIYKKHKDKTVLVVEEKEEGLVANQM